MKSQQDISVKKGTHTVKLNDNSIDLLKKLTKQIKDKDIAEALELPPIKLHCSVLAEDSISKAIEDWENKLARRQHNQL